MNVSDIILAYLFSYMYSILNEKQLVFRHGLIWPYLWLIPPVAIHHNSYWISHSQMLDKVVYQLCHIITKDAEIRYRQIS